MANAYSRTTKLKSISGRSDYISNPNRQENIVLHKKNMEHEWSEYADFEKENQRSNVANNQGREIVIALPNELSKNPEKLKKVCDDLSKKMLGNNRDYEYAVHWNAAKTNLHMHLIFSERERNTERQPKVYKRDMWYDKDSNKMAKAHADNAELRFKKGEVMKDKEGNIRFDDEKPFTVKDKKFKSKMFLVEQKKIIQETFKEHGFHIDIFDSKKEIAQKKLYKGSSKEYKDYARKYNEKARVHNQLNRQLNQAKPIQESINDLHREITKLNKKIGSESKKNFIEKFLSSESIKELKEELKGKQKEITQKFKDLVKLFHEKIPSNTTVSNASEKTELVLENQFKVMKKISEELKEVNSFSKFTHKQEVEKRELESYKKDVEQAIKEKKEVTFSKDWLKNKDNELRMNRRLSREGKLKEQDMER